MHPTDYPFEVRPLSEEEGGGYLATFPDLPGCMADGETPDATIQEALDAATSWLETAQEFGDPIPGPGGASSGKFIVRLPRSLHTRLSVRAKQEGVSMNAWVTAVLAENLGHHEATR